MCFILDESKKFFNFMKNFVTTVLLLAQKVSIQNLPPLLPLGNIFFFNFKGLFINIIC